MSANLKRLLFENIALRQTIFKNTFWLAVSNVAGRLIRALLLIYAARILGTAGYGVFSYAVGLAALFSIFSDIGITGILIREGAREPKQLGVYVGTSLLLKFALLAVSVVIMLVLTPHINRIPEAAALIPWAAFLIFFDTFRDFAVSVKRAKEEMQMDAVVSIITNLAITAFGIFLLILKPTPLMFIAGYTIGSAVGMFFSFFLIRKVLRESISQVKKELMLPILAAGVPFGLIGVLGALMLQTDMIMLGYYTSAEALGLYAAAQRPILFLYVIPGILATALFPTMSRLASTDEGRLRTLLERGLTFSFLFTIPLFVGGLVLSESLMVFLFGEAYRSATLTFSILLGTVLINYPAALIGNALFAFNKQKLLMWAMAAGAASNVFFNFLLIPRWGIVGSAIATILAQLIINGVTWIYLKRISSFHTLAYIYKIIVASLFMGAMTATLNYLGVNLILNIIGSVALYFGLLFLLKEDILRYFHPRGLLAESST